MESSSLPILPFPWKTLGYGAYEREWIFLWILLLVLIGMWLYSRWRTLEVTRSSESSSSSTPSSPMDAEITLIRSLEMEKDPRIFLEKMEAIIRKSHALKPHWTVDECIAQGIPSKVRTLLLMLRKARFSWRELRETDRQELLQHFLASHHESAR